MTLDDGVSRVAASGAGPAESGVPEVEAALLGGAPQRVGRFEYRYDTDTWIWSDTVARIHGYEPGQVQPTTELVLSHKHPDDLANVQALLHKSAAPFSSRHRIRTVSGEIRKVVVVGEAVTDDDTGQVVATRGFYVDVTEAIAADVQGGVSDELGSIVALREIIEQAKGMLMLAYDLSAEAAFDILRWRSQELNVKVNVIAAQLVKHLPLLMDSGPSRVAIDNFLMTLQLPPDA